MCGIAAIFGYGRSAPPVDAREGKRLIDAMFHRGPDAGGLWLSPDRRVALGHRRLAIIDVGASGNQPMFLAGTETGITFNGEIYNFRELRRELEQKGRVFHTNSDTEVLLHAYDEFGADMVHRLRGMYAFAIWDARRQGLFLARDPMGIKPLYYVDDGDTFRIASQVKALLAAGVESTLDPAACVSFFLLGYIAEPFTIRRRIKALPAGHSLWVDASGAGAPRRFFSVREVLAKADAAAAAGLVPDQIVRDIAESVAAHMVADVPVGLFLSAGLDSTSLAALAVEGSGLRLRTLTLGFLEYGNTAQDEVPIAEEVARALHTMHTTVWVQGRDFLHERQHVLEAMDQPTTDGVNTFFVSKAAHKAGLKVALSGLGGDELFGGYDTYSQVPRVARALGTFRAYPVLGSGLRKIASSLIGQRISPKYAGLLEYGTSLEDAYLLRRALYMPWELPHILDPDLVRAGWAGLRPLISLRETISGLRRDRARVAALEMSWYMRSQLLRDTDWAGMAHSVEIRTPLVDAWLLGGVAPAIVQRRPPSKREIAAATPIGRIPAVMGRVKTGFVVPVREWLIGESGAAAGDRGLRGWSKLVFAHHGGADALAAPSLPASA